MISYGDKQPFLHIGQHIYFKAKGVNIGGGLCGVLISWDSIGFFRKRDVGVFRGSKDR